MAAQRNFLGKTGSFFKSGTQPKFNNPPLKIGGWKATLSTFLLGFGNFSGANC